MNEIRVIGRWHDAKRDLAVVNVDDLKTAEFSVPTTLRPFVAFTALDATQYSTDEVAGFCRKVLQQGSTATCSWGPECVRVETGFDLVFVDAELSGEPYLDELETTWHPSESLDEALWFALFCAFPHGAAGQHIANAVIAFAAPAWLPHIEARFANPDRLSADVVGEND
jgi:hypothetical protein